MLSFPRRVSVILIQRVRSKLFARHVLYILMNRHGSYIQRETLSLFVVYERIQLSRWCRASVGVVRSSLYFMRHLPPSLSLFTEHTEWKTRYITKENKFSIKAKCYELRHKHPVERATPEARTYALVCIREREKKRERKTTLVLISDLGTRIFCHCLKCSNTSILIRFKIYYFYIKLFINIDLIQIFKCHSIKQDLFFYLTLYINYTYTMYFVL